MASIRQEIEIAADAAQAWDAIRDFGAVHRRVAPGFLTDLTLDDGARTVTFRNGNVARELLVDCDDKAMRLVYAVVGGRVTTHSASVQVMATGQGRCRLVWITDVLPNEIADYIRSQMAEAAPIMQRTLALARVE